MNYLSRIKVILNESTLSIKNQEELLDTIKNAKTNDLKLLFNVFEKYPDSIQLIYKYYKMKKNVLSQNNINEWRKIISEEYKELAKIDSEEKLNILRRIINK